MIFFKEKKTRWVKKVISMGLDCKIKRNHTAILGAEKHGPHRSRDGTAQGPTVTALPPSRPSVLGTHRVLGAKTAPGSAAPSGILRSGCPPATEFQRVHKQVHAQPHAMHTIPTGPLVLPDVSHTTH